MSREATASPSPSAWKGTTAGTRRMHRWLIASLRVLPLWFVYAGATVLVVPWCMLFAHKGYISQYHFFRKRFHCGVLSAVWHTYRNHCMFAKAIIDRFYVYAGGTLRLDVPHYDRFDRLTKCSDGFVILSAHVGNYEAAGYALTSHRKKYNALVFGGEAQTVMENRRRMLGRNNIGMIAVTDDLSHIFRINEALSNNEIVSIPGDRIFGSPRTLKCNFLGATAPFPLGPFSIAAGREIPVLCINVMRTGYKRYQIHIDELPTPQGNSRQRAQALAESFARNLEQCVRKYPTQWYNYYEFWNN